MTGTPVENRLSELWAIIDFLNPGYLGSREAFRRSFAVPIERWRDADRAAELRKLVRPFVLRRVKTDPNVIQDLPEKLESRVYCTLTASRPPSTRRWSTRCCARSTTPTGSSGAAGCWRRSCGSSRSATTRPASSARATVDRSAGAPASWPGWRRCWKR